MVVLLRSTRVAQAHVIIRKQRQRRLKRRKVAAVSSNDVSATYRPTLQPALDGARLDHYEAAAYRLQALLNGLGDGEDEMLLNILEDEPAESKVQLAAISGAMLVFGACSICWLCNADPFGGASLSLSSLQAAAVGVVAAAPMLVMKQLLWSKQAYSTFAALEDAHFLQAQYMLPATRGLTAAQLAAVLLMDVVPNAMMVLPAAQSGLQSAFAMQFTPLSSFGFALPDGVPQVLALLITASIAALSRAVMFATPEEQKEAVKDAISNADRFYRVAGPSSHAAVAADHTAAASAFKAVAYTWLHNQQQASKVLAALTLFETIYYGVLWYATGDLTAPIVAGLIHAAFEHRTMLQLPSTREI